LLYLVLGVTIKNTAVCWRGVPVWFLWILAETSNILPFDIKVSDFFFKPDGVVS
jgi:hypothetical protein